jgi:hypothetical protein
MGPGYAIEVDDPELGVVVVGVHRHRNTALQEAKKFAAARGWEVRQ